MSTEFIPTTQASVLTSAKTGFMLPASIADQGEKAAERFFTFFTDTIPNPNTRAAYDRKATKIDLLIFISIDKE